MSTALGDSAPSEVPHPVKEADAGAKDLVPPSSSPTTIDSVLPTSVPVSTGEGIDLDVSSSAAPDLAMEDKAESSVTRDSVIEASSVVGPVPNVNFAGVEDHAAAKPEALSTAETGTSSLAAAPSAMQKARPKPADGVADSSSQPERWAQSSLVVPDPFIREKVIALYCLSCIVY